MDGGSWHPHCRQRRVGGRENCTLRRFRIRGLIEGMLRTVMGNIWAVTKHSSAKRSQGKGRQEDRERKWGRTRKDQGRRGKGYGGKRETEHES